MAAKKIGRGCPLPFKKATIHGTNHAEQYLQPIYHAEQYLCDMMCEKIFTTHLRRDMICHAYKPVQGHAEKILQAIYDVI